MNHPPEKSPLLLGKLTLPGNIFYAPLAGCSDYPFRQMSAKFRPDLMYCEMVKMEPLVRGDRQTLKYLDYCQSMRPIGGQICGSNPAIAGKAARMVEELGFDVVDLNCGCPVDKVTKDGSGSGMLKTPERIFDTLANMVAAVRIPVTVKIRAGWDEQSINAVEVTRLAEQAGAAAICIHGRTREQAYRGAANWDYIAQCKQAATTIKVIGNGDLFTPAAIQEMLQRTGCDAVLIARGTMGQPWIAEQIREQRAGKEITERTLEESKAALLEHFRYMLAYHSEQKAVIEMRRVGCWYLKEVAGARAFRNAICSAASPDEMFTLIREFGCHCEE